MTDEQNYCRRCAASRNERDISRHYVVVRKCRFCKGTIDETEGFWHTPEEVKKEVEVVADVSGVDSWLAELEEKFGVKHVSIPDREGMGEFAWRLSETGSPWGCRADYRAYMNGTCALLLTCGTDAETVIAEGSGLLPICAGHGVEAYGAIRPNPADSYWGVGQRFSIMGLTTEIFPVLFKRLAGAMASIAGKFGIADPHE